MGVGILCVVAAIVGGGVTLAGQEIHTLTSVWREILLGVFGVVLMAGSLVLRPAGPDGAREPPAGPAGEDPAERSDRTLTVELDTDATTRVYTYLGAVGQAMKDRGFRDLTVTRVRLVLDELITNVAHHVRGRTARVSVTIQEQHLRVVSVEVCDRGPGLSPEVLAESERRLGEGEREHGLMLARRLAAELKITSQATTSREQWRCVSCDVIEPPVPRSPLFEFRDFAWVRMEYGGPMVYWLGPEFYVDTRPPYGFSWRLNTALKNGWRPVLDLYLRHLTDRRYRPYLVVEAAGEEVGTRYAEDRGVHIPLRAVLESYFTDHFRERRVLLLASDAGYEVRWSVMEWARERQLDYFDSEPAFRARLKELSR